MNPNASVDAVNAASLFLRILAELKKDPVYHASEMTKAAVIKAVTELTIEVMKKRDR